MNKIKQAKNALKIDEIEKLNPKERQEHCITLNKGGMSEIAIGLMLDRPKSTIHDWISDRQVNTPGNLHVSIDQLIKHFKLYEPKKNEVDKIRELIKVLDVLLVKEIQYSA